MNSKAYCVAILLAVFTTPCWAQGNPHAKAVGSTVAVPSVPATPDKPAKIVPELPLLTRIERAVSRAQHKQTVSKDSCKCTCPRQSLTPEQILAAEVQLQHIRDTQDYRATFQTHPYLLKPDSCACKPKQVSSQKKTSCKCRTQ